MSRRDDTDHRDLLTSILESGFDAILTKTLDGTITSWNTGAAKIYGYTAQEIIGKNVSLLSPPGRLNEMPEILARLQRGEEIDHYGTERLRKDGKVINVSVSVSPLRNETGVIIGAATIARDVTAEHRLSRYARSLIETSLDPFVTISPDGKITDVNEATVRVTGVAREDLVGTDFSNYFTEPSKARDGYREAFARGFVTDYPLTIRHQGGRFTDVLYNASVYKDMGGSVLGIFAAARDITAMKKAEQELAEQRRREQDRLLELERFQKLTVGRELKMIELKSEIRDLQKEVADLRQRLAP